MSDAAEYLNAIADGMEEMEALNEDGTSAAVPILCAPLEVLVSKGLNLRNCEQLQVDRTW